ncbi:ornithine cyclodeaminase family protein [Lactobacillus sp. ESL0681]|uniref:ornithine cyclodeaminase family protein n=1 Tax=Lactobacillus sp. ESL0681 TaxID=2983211 RepID=UPI0023F713EB|nr:ornithine cyclodeaminase family protein [Lactobacillus sp. ESL0681]WEV39531.1 ornithine cyclodeaminase family protein [Lactobacillus sp. ESL0681]
MLLLKKADIQKCYTLKDAMTAVTEAFRLFSKGEVEVPLRTQIVNRQQTGSYLCMPAFCESADAACVKVLNMFPDNPKQNLPTINAQVLTIDTNTGVINGMMDGNYVTQLRTGAASGVAFQNLAKQNCTKGAVIGTGGQAATQLEAMLNARKLELVEVSDRDYPRAQEFAQAMSEQLANYGAKIVAVPTADEAVRDADLIISVTSSTQPVYDGKLVKAGATVSGVGAYQPQMQETPVELLQRTDKIYFDSQEAVLAESGDLIIPLKQKTINQDKFVGDLGQVISGDLPARENDQEIIFFETVGIAAQDLLTAKSIYDRALAANVGMQW